MYYIVDASAKAIWGKRGHPFQQYRPQEVFLNLIAGAIWVRARLHCKSAILTGPTFSMHIEPIFLL